MAGTQLPLFAPESSWRPPDLASLPDWGDAKRVGYDLETKDLQLSTMGPGVRRPGNYVVGYGFAIEDGPEFYLPVAHEGGDNLPRENVEAYLRHQAKNFKGELVGGNINYDLDWSEEQGITFPAVKAVRDALVTEALINELQNGYRLQDVCERRLGRGKEEVLLREAITAYGKGFDPKKDLWRLPARYVGPYGCFDARSPLLLLRSQERDIEEQGLWNIYDLESAVLPILVRMRRRGVRVDTDRLSSIVDWLLVNEREQCRIVKEKTGITITPESWWKPEELEPVLTQVGVNVPRTAKKGKPSIDKFLLAAYDHPVVDAIERGRKLSKVRQSGASIRSHLCNGRIHPTFNQSRRQDDFANDDDEEGARYGRLSCVDPNLQQQHARDKELGPKWRSIYRPDEGGEWASMDFSQQEPRLTVHYAVKAYHYKRSIGRNYEDFEKALDAARRYREDPSTDYHQMMADFTGLERKQAKEIFLGLAYGMGGAKLCGKLGLPTQWVDRNGRQLEVAGPAGQKILDQFDGEVPFIKKLAKFCETEAKKKGYIETIEGRHCHFPKTLDGGGYDWCHKALNRLIQGSSADQAKRALIEVERAGHAVQLQVHDEFDLTVRDRSHAEEIARIMRDCVQLEVPSKVDVEVGPSWGEAA